MDEILIDKRIPATVCNVYILPVYP